MNVKELLASGCSEFNVSLDDKIDIFIKYKDLLLDWNNRINLTSITKEDEIIVKHFIDSIGVLKFVDLTNKKIIDIGTGAGFPGIPLKIVNNSIDMTLLDSLNKRILFLKELVKELNLKNIQIIHGRAEDYGQNPKFREKYDICISRAVATLSVLSEYCLPFVKIGGHFISLKGPNIEQEIKEAEKAISVLGGKIEKIENFNLPYLKEQRNIIFIKKIKQCPSNYPRKAGKPSKQPIR